MPRSNSSQLLDQIFEESPASMTIMVGPDFIYERANASFYKFTGLTSDIIGKSLREIYPELDGQGMMRILEEVYYTGNPYRGQNVRVTFNTPEGTRTRYVDFIYQPLKNGDGSVYGVLSQSSDVTGIYAEMTAISETKRALEIERENFRNLFRQTPEMAVILSGPHHTFEFCSEAHIKVLGFDATGMTLKQAQPESVEVHGILDEVYRTGKTAHLNEIEVTLGDQKRYFDLTYAARRDEDGEVNGIMILGTEVTKRVLSERHMKEHQSSLDAAIRARDEFLSIASHELKTPITTLKLQTHIYQRALKSNDHFYFQQEKVASFVDQCERQTNRIANLVENIFDVSRITNGYIDLRPETFDLNFVIQDVIDRISMQFQHGDHPAIKFTCPQSLMVTVDKLRIEQVLTNLVSNAFKYGLNRQIQLTVEDKETTIKIRIKDDGIGIRPELHEKIFERFERAIHVHEVSGLGLGLYITRQIVNAHQGSVVVESEEGKGSEFIVTLPKNLQLKTF